MITLSQLWPRAQVRELQAENKELRDTLKTAIDNEALTRRQLGAAIQDAVEARKESATTLKKMVNFQMLAAGSKVVMFEDVGPNPPPKREPVEVPQSMGRVNASVLARKSRANYLEEFMKSQSGNAEPIPYEDENEDTKVS